MSNFDIESLIERVHFNRNVKAEVIEDIFNTIENKYTEWVPLSVDLTINYIIPQNLLDQALGPSGPVIHFNKIIGTSYDKFSSFVKPELIFTFASTHNICKNKTYIFGVFRYKNNYGHILTNIIVIDKKQYDKVISTIIPIKRTEILNL